jgi:hypothetical protein
MIAYFKEQGLNEQVSSELLDEALKQAQVVFP